MMEEQAIIDVKEKDFFEKVIKQSEEVPVVVNFWAGWCMPCLMLSSILEKLAKEYKGKFILAKANINEVEKFAEKYKIRSIPNVKLFKNGKVVDEFVGAIPERMVREWLEKI